MRIPFRNKRIGNLSGRWTHAGSGVALGIAIVVFMASLAIEYYRIGQGDAFFWSAMAGAFFLLVCNAAFFATTRDEPGALMAGSLVAVAAAFALCGAVTILVGGLPWQDYAATTAMAMIFLAIFLPNRPAQAMLSVIITAVAYVGLLPFLDSAGNIVRLVIVEGVVLFACLAAIHRNARVRRAVFLQGIELLAARESSRAKLSEAEFQRQTFEEAAADGVTLIEDLALAREDANGNRPSCALCWTIFPRVYSCSTRK